MVSCVDTCFAMEPARALHLKGYAVMFGSAVQYTSNIGVLYGFVTGDITYIGVYMGAFCGCMVAMYVVAANLASAALAKVPDKEENRQLCRRLRSLRKGAVMAGAPIAFMGLCFCVAIVVVPAVSRQAGAATITLGLTAFVWSFAWSWRRRRQRQHVAVAPDAAGVDGRRALRRLGHSTAMLALGVHERGVSLEFLQRFAQQKGVGKRASAAEVCEQEVKPPALRRFAGEARCSAATRRAADAMGHKIVRAYGYAKHT